MKARTHGLVWLVALATAWLPTWIHLSNEWRSNEQYQFGWVIPVLFLYNGWRCWRGNATPTAPSPLWIFTLALSAGCFAAGSFLVWRDPLWRLSGGLTALGSLLLTGTWFYRVGGKPMLQRQFMTLAIACFAVPWPSPLEHAVTTHLLNLVTGLTTGLLNNLGIAALRHGSLIELSNVWFGMEEACSGIQSFQAVLMAAVFLGELANLSMARRAGLLLGGILLCLVSNSLRILGLVWILHTCGSISTGWHDAVGTTASLLLFGGVGAAAFFMARRAEDAGKRIPPWFCGADGYAILACFSIISLGMLAISTNHATRSTPSQIGHLTTKSLPPGWKAEALPPHAVEQTMLRYSRSESYMVFTAAGWPAEVSHFSWDGAYRIPGAAFVHTPALCMANQGWTPADAPETLALHVHGHDLAAIAYPMRRESITRVVVQILVAENGGTLQPTPGARSGWLSRLVASWHGTGQRICNEFLIVVPDFGDSRLTAQACSELLEALTWANESQ